MYATNYCCLLRTGAPAAVAAALAAGQREQIPEESPALDSGKLRNENNSPVQTNRNDKQSPTMAIKSTIGGLENQSPGSIQSPTDQNGSLAPRGGESDSESLRGVKDQSPVQVGGEDNQVEEVGNTAAAGGQSRHQMKDQLNLLKDSPVTEPAPGIAPAKSLYVRMQLLEDLTQNEQQLFNISDIKISFDFFV